MNFDGSTVGNPGIGGVIRESASKCKLSFSGPVGMLPMRIGLNKAHNLNLCNLMVEGNSLCAIR